jgi:hypothetical protein
MKTALIGLLPGLLALGVLATSTAAEAGALGTKDQRAKEELALRLLKSAPVQREIRKLEEVYRRDPIAATPSGSATLERAVKSIAMAAIYHAVNEDTDRPVVLWTTSASHKWFGMDVPESLYGIDCPDNIYRTIPLDVAARYEIHGRINRSAPAQQTFVLFNGIPGLTEAMNKDGHMIELGGFQSSEMDINPDGTFIVTVDRDPADGRKNHIQSDAGNAHMQLLVRDTFSDWTAQNPISLTVNRTAGPPLRPTLTEAKFETRAAEILAAMGPYWRNWFNTRIYTKPVNHIDAPWARAKGWGFAAFGHFNIAADEAWVVTLDPLRAAYFSFQLADPWGVAMDYIDHSGSLNQTQAKPNPDGTYTFVVAAHDPGVLNWLDTGGLSAGVYTLRWQGIAADTTAERSVRDAQIVMLKDLKSALPPGTAFISADQRKAQLAARAASYARRLVN